MGYKSIDYDIIDLDLEDELEEVEEEKIEKNIKPKKRMKKTKRKILGFLGISFALLLIAYGGIAFYYQTRFFPNTIINGIDCGNLKVEEATILVEAQEHYTLDIKGRNPQNEDEIILLGTLAAEDIQLVYVNTATELAEILENQNHLLWIEVLMGQTYDHTLGMGIDFDKELLREKIFAWEACQEVNMQIPQNAYIGDYNAESGKYELIPETLGTLLDLEAVFAVVENAIYQNESVVDLEAENCYCIAEITSENENLTKNFDTINHWVNTQITYDWNGREVILNGDKIQEWISFQEGSPVLDEEAVAEFVKEQAKQFDTYGKNKSFVTALGVELTLPNGGYGWKTDRSGETEELIQLIYQGSTLQKEPLYTSKGAKKGSNDIGSSYVEIDLSNQHLYLYQNGNLILQTDFVSGNMSRSDCVTPPGVFGLTYKTRDAVLRGDDYETPVSYWMPFNGNIGMHDATWRTQFGGDIYLTSGSHGCINLPFDMAAAIYSYVSTGFPVICYYY